MEKQIEKKALAKGYEKYTAQFLPKPPYLKNCLWAFFVGGALCTIAHYISNLLMNMGVEKKDAETFVTVGVIILAQLLTGFGVFDSIAKYAGAGVIVPISGFANSMVAPVIEYKREGPVLGAGAKLFTVAGPVLVCGITAATVTGIAYWAFGLF